MEYINYWSQEFDLNLKVSFTPYNQVFQQLLNPESFLNTNYGINVLFIRSEDWIRDQAGISTSEKISHLEKTCSELITAIESAIEINHISYLVGIVPILDSSIYSEELYNCLIAIYKRLTSFCSSCSYIQLLDLIKIAELYKVDEIYDAKSDELGHMPFSPEYYAAVGTYIVRKINAFKGPNYKVIVLDCDNTLWKGICGELGAKSVIIDTYFTQLQEFLIEKYNEGFLLALCSKNNESDVWEVFDTHPDMILKREHIIAYKINWDPKPENILEIASELNLSLNSFIFIDDNEFETEQMNLIRPDVLSLQLPENSENFMEYVNHIWAFDTYRATDEDINRNLRYQHEKQRKDEQTKFGSLNEFVESLRIEVEIKNLGISEIERAVQLTMRTNQFNLNGILKTPELIASAINNSENINWIIDVKDRFGDYGLVGFLQANRKNNTLILESFMLSCRVLGRNVEDIILSELQKYCIQIQISQISALYKNTDKNQPIKDFLERTGWVYDSNTMFYNLEIKVVYQVNDE